MFGYVRYDLPNLFVKDMMLYKSLYCGLCKGIGASCGQMARLGLSYDMTFLSALLHNLMQVDVVIEQQNCFEHAIKKRPIAAADGLTKELGALNTILVYYKLTDDSADGEKKRGRRLWFSRGYRRAKKQYPALDGLVGEFIKEQARAEGEKETSPDRAAEPTAQLMLKLSRHFLGEKASASTDGLFYALGKWVYLIDALDDFDKDKKRGNFNPFVLSFGSADKKSLMQEHGEEIGFLFDTLFYSLREGLAGCVFRFNRDLTDNVILRGIPLETMRVMNGEAPVKMTVRI